MLFGGGCAPLDGMDAAADAPRGSERESMDFHESRESLCRARVRGRNPRRRAPGRLTAALRLVFGTWLLTALVGLALAIPGAGAQSINVTVCTGDPATEPASCQSSTAAPGASTPATPRRRVRKHRSRPVRAAAIAPRRRARHRARPHQTSPVPRTETHTVDLATGKATVATGNGPPVPEHVSVKLSPRVARLLHRQGQGANGSTAANPAPAPTVSTVGGAGLGSSPFSAVSADQALSQFQIPPFLLPIYFSAGRTYGIPWNVLAAINKIETSFGTDLSVSTAGAEGWMQFMPAEWPQYGVDATGKGYADPYNPADAIYAAARDLRDNGGMTDIRKAVFAYNHAQWYVDEVMQNASIYGSVPQGVIAETGSLAYGHFPVRGKVTYGDDFASTRALTVSTEPGAQAVATQQVTVQRVLLDPTSAALLRARGTVSPLGGATAAPAASARASISSLGGTLLGLSSVVRTLSAGVIDPGARVTTLVAALSKTVPPDAPAGTGHDPGLPSGYFVSKKGGLGAELRDSVGDTYRYTGLARLSANVRPGASLYGGEAIGWTPGVQPAAAAGPSGATATIAAAAAPAAAAAKPSTALSSAPAQLQLAITAAGGQPIDPRPLVDSYRLQEATNFYRAVTPSGNNPFVPEATGASGSVDAMTSAADQISGQHLPYLWGGGHDAGFTGPYDCSGAVSAVLHAAGLLNTPLVSTDFMNYGLPGPGTVTIYANPEHVYMSIGGRFFGTSGSNPGGGAGWFDGSPRDGFVVRHVPVLGDGGSGYVFPIPNDVKWTSGRTDMGWDIETGSAGVGHPLLAIGDAQILHIQDMGAFGPTWMSYKLTSGPAAGRTVFIGHSGAPLVRPGDTVRAGQPIIQIHGGSYGGPPGHLEIGWADGDGSNTLAAPHYHEGDATAEGASFQQFARQLSGSMSSLTLLGGLSSLNPTKATPAEEAKLSQVLDRVSNPKVARKPGPGSVRDPAARLRATHPDAAHAPVAPAATGGHVIAVAVPDRPRGEQAYALATVGGAGHPGWAPQQIVYERESGGAWRVLGPVTDAKGKPQNPLLTALAVTDGGYGYAVGPHGALAALSPAGARQVPSPVKSNLTSVAAHQAGAQVVGEAVGERGTVVRLAAGRATGVAHAPGNAPLAGVAYDGALPTLVSPVGRGGAELGKTGAGLYTDDGRALHPQSPSLGLPAGASVSLSALTARGGQLWLGGALTLGGDPQVGGTGPIPFAAHRGGAGWRSYCASGPTAAGVIELGPATRSVCQGTLTASQGTVSSISVSKGGVLLSTGSGLQLVDGDAGRALALPNAAAGSSPTTYTTTAGWILDGRGGLARLDGAASDGAPAGTPAVSGPAAAAPATALPLDGRSGPAVLAQPATGSGKPSGSLLALTAARAATTGPDGHSQAFSAPGVALQQAVQTAAGQTWAISSTGDLLGASGGRWSLADPSGRRLGDLRGLSGALGSAPLSGPGDTSPSPGFGALAFRGPGEGYAVGAGGVIARYDGHAWKVESRADSSHPALTSVAAGPGGVVAVGQRGTLVQRDGDSWSTPGSVRKLTSDQDLTAAAALSDGTLLAAGPAGILARPAGGSWSSAPTTALGAPVSRLDGYRDGAGQLHVLALVAGAGGKVLLDGDDSGWQTVGAPAGLSVTDFHFDPAAGKLVLVGQQNGRDAVARVSYPPAVPASPAAPPGPPAVALGQALSSLFA
ncbi:MAG: lytic transglycosylase domain-containing protein [Actinobacteria bacterium]|nr:MAG: lytic transglycosylase domain-containing protein [Actinomycetota bacterium]